MIKSKDNWYNIFETLNLAFKFRVFISIIVLLVVPILFFYRLFPSSSTELFMGFNNLRDFIFFFGNIISPIILILGVIFDAYKITYIPVFFVYSIDLVWILNPSVTHFSFFNFLYASLITLGLVLFFKAMLHVKTFQNKIDVQAEETLKQIQNEIDRLEAEGE